MVAAGFASGLAIQWISPETVSQYLGNTLLGVAIAATIGISINVPLLFEIPLVALLLLMGMGTAPAATLLFTAAAGGPVTFWGLARIMPKRAIAVFATSTWVLGAFGGLAVLGMGAVIWDLPQRSEPMAIDASSSASKATSITVPEAAVTSPSPSPARTAAGAIKTEPGGPAEVAPFTNVAPRVLSKNSFVKNLYPGVAIFDYDRDGDMDFYVTQAESDPILEFAQGGPNRLFRNNGDGSFTEVAEEAGVAAAVSNSTAAAACDFDNDGYQDLYVAAQGRMGDHMDYRSVDIVLGLREVIKDRLFLNNRDGTFTEITDSAFGDDVNIRSAMAVACSDVDGDGWLDIYVGNRADEDYIRFDQPDHHGHYNDLFRNNGDLTFTDVSVEAGVAGPQIVMRDPFGVPYTFQDAVTGRVYEGYDPKQRDAAGNRVGDPTGQSWSVLFYDYDDDGDQDLWVADDGDRLKVYRNDSAPGSFRFTPVARAMGVDMTGAWMGFALGDYDGDADLDVFVTNIGYHPLTRLPPYPGADCAYGHRFTWGTCTHFLLRNDGVVAVTGLGTIGRFVDVAPSTRVRPSRIMPPDSLVPSNIDPAWQLPTGLAAYDFGFGAAFFDFDNDADQDLYWLGATLARGEAPRGEFYPGSGRMLRSDGRGSFEDITVEAHLLDIQDVDYSVMDPGDPRFDARRQRIGPQFHENGKGLAKCDLDGDGYVDLIGTNSSGPVLSRAERKRTSGVSTLGDYVRPSVKGKCPPSRLPC